jgi:preprotein translocase subunit SecG
MNFSAFVMQQEVVELIDLLNSESLHLILLVAQVVIAVSLIGFILIQHGKGADAGAAFGSGASSTVFGSQGSSNFLTKATAILAFLFLANSLSLAYIASRRMNTVESLTAMDQRKCHIWNGWLVKSYEKRLRQVLLSMWIAIRMPYDPAYLNP